MNISKELDYFDMLLSEMKKNIKVIPKRSREEIRKRLKAFLWAIVFPYFLRRGKKEKIQ